MMDVSGFSSIVEVISMRRARLFFALLLSLVLAIPMAVAAGVATAGGAAAATRVPTLVGIRAAHHPGYDRVVFDFVGGLPTTRTVRYVNQLIADGSGLPVPIAGRAILSVVMFPTNAHDASGRPTAPAKLAFALPNVMSVVRAGDFEAVTSYGIGLAKNQSVSTFTLRNPDRLVIDIKTAFTTTTAKVWLFNQKRFLAATEPYFTPVSRLVPAASPGAGVMDRIFAGPTASEYAAGLRFLPSAATGWTNLRIASKVARVQLTGGCSSGGSTVSIAGEIMPSLRQFSTVDWVKIYDTTGHTERPSGLSDSIPECLEP